MTQPAILIEPAPLLPASAEVNLLADVVARDPRKAVARTRLVGLLADLDRFDEAVMFAEQAAAPADLEHALNHCRALFGQQDHDADRRVLEVIADQLGRANQPKAQARLLADQAKALLRLGQTERAVETLFDALERYPQSLVAFERLTYPLLRQKRYGEVRQLAAKLSAQGITHARLLSAQTLANVALGDDQAAQELLGTAWLPPTAAVAPPPGWSNLADLNAAAAQELLADPSMRLRRHGTASQSTRRVDHPARPGARAVESLLSAIATAASAWIAALPARSHPWLMSRPDCLVLQSWCVITGAEGLERWHMHNVGWLSGGYYIAVPAAVADGTDQAGSLAFGVPPDLVGTAAAMRFGERLVRPKPGMLSLFPSHAHHRTYPHGTAEDRICLAFDLVPG